MPCLRKPSEEQNDNRIVYHQHIMLHNLGTHFVVSISACETCTLTKPNKQAGVCFYWTADMRGTQSFRPQAVNKNYTDTWSAPDVSPETRESDERTVNASIKRMQTSLNATRRVIFARRGNWRAPADWSLRGAVTRLIIVLPSGAAGNISVRQRSKLMTSPPVWASHMLSKEKRS